METVSENNPSANRPAGKLRRAAFYASLVVFLLLLGFLSPLPFLILGWFLEPEAGEVSHQVHEISFGGLFALSFVAVITQFRRPANKPAAALQAAIPILLMAAAATILGEIDPFVVIFVIAALLPLVLHPARRDIFRPRTHVSVPLLALVVIAALPLTYFAMAQLRTGAEASPIAKKAFEGLPDDASDERYEAAIEAATSNPEEQAQVEHSGHWTAMGAFAFAILAVGLVAAFRIRGWRLSAWSAAAALAIYSAASLTVPRDASAQSTGWALAGLVGAIVFVVIGEREVRTERERAEEGQSAAMSIPVSQT